MRRPRRSILRRDRLFATPGGPLCCVLVVVVFKVQLEQRRRVQRYADHVTAHVVGPQWTIVCICLARRSFLRVFREHSWGQSTHLEDENHTWLCFSCRDIWYRPTTYKRVSTQVNNKIHIQYFGTNSNFRFMSTRFRLGIPEPSAAWRAAAASVTGRTHPRVSPWSQNVIFGQFSSSFPCFNETPPLGDITTLPPRLAKVVLAVHGLAYEIKNDASQYSSKYRLISNLRRASRRPREIEHFGERALELERSRLHVELSYVLVSPGPLITSTARPS